jgi:hypothetical protein
MAAPLSPGAGLGVLAPVQSLHRRSLCSRGVQPTCLQLQRPAAALICCIQPQCQPLRPAAAPVAPGTSTLVAGRARPPWRWAQLLAATAH